MVLAHADQGQQRRLEYPTSGSSFKVGTSRIGSRKAEHNSTTSGKLLFWKQDP